MKIKTRPDAIAKLMTGLVAGLPETARLFSEALETAQNNRPPVIARMHKAEAEADERHLEFLTKVGDTFITPFDREDLFSMAEVLEDVIDTLDHGADLLVRCELGELPKPFIVGAQDLDEMATLAAEATELIKRPKKFRSVWDDVTTIENRMDERNNEIIADLFSGRHDIFLALKLKVIAETIEDSANMLDRFVRTLARTAIKES